MRSLMALLVLCIMMTQVTFTQDKNARYYFLKIEGKASQLKKVSVNGRTVLEGTITSVQMPLPITRSLQEGTNTLHLEFISHPDEELSLHIEQRTINSRMSLDHWSFRPDASKGKLTKQSLTFHIPQGALPRYATKLTPVDQEQIRQLIRQQHQAFAQRDYTAIQRLFQTSIAQESLIYPEGARFYKSILEFAFKDIISNPKFKMMPLQLDNLQFITEGDLVIVRRSDGKAVLQSYEMREDAEILHGKGKQQWSSKSRMTSQLAAEQLHFKRYNGRWHSCLGL